MKIRRVLIIAPPEGDTERFVLAAESPYTVTVATNADDGLRRLRQGPGDWFAVVTAFSIAKAPGGPLYSYGLRVAAECMDRGTPCVVLHEGLDEGEAELLRSLSSRMDFIALSRDAVDDGMYELHPDQPPPEEYDAHPGRVMVPAGERKTHARSAARYREHGDLLWFTIELLFERFVDYEPFEEELEAARYRMEREREARLHASDAPHAQQ